MNKEETREQSLTVENRRRLNMTGVVSVDGFSEEVIRLSLSDGKTVISGEGLKIVGFSKQTGTLTAEGLVHAIRFAGKRAPLLKRIFK